MKIKNPIKNLFVVYLNKYYYKFDDNTIEECIKKVLMYLKNNYGIEIFSKFLINCYINEYYGVILEIEREYDTFLLYSKKTDIDITYIESDIFMKVYDYFMSNNTFIVDNEYYVKLDENNYDVLIEQSYDIVYGDKLKC